MSRPLASFPRAGLSLALGALLALPPGGASATALAPNPRQRSESLLAEGDAAASKQRWDEAISKYRASYYGLPPEDQASYLGSLPVRQAMRAYDQRVAQERDEGKRRALLRRQRVLLEEFLDAVAAKRGAAEEVGADVIAELEQLRRSIDEALDGPPKADHSEADPEPESTDEIEPDDEEATSAPTDPAGPVSPEPAPASDSPRPPRDWLGLGLVIGGSALLVTGVGVSVGWWTIRNTAQENVDAGGADFAEGTQARAKYLADEEARAKQFLIGGSVVAGVGLAAALGGVIHLALHRRSASSGSTALLPVLSPTAAGFVLKRRF